MYFTDFTYYHGISQARRKYILLPQRTTLFPLFLYNYMLPIRRSVFRVNLSAEYPVIGGTDHYHHFMTYLYFAKSYRPNTSWNYLKRSDTGGCEKWYRFTQSEARRSLILWISKQKGVVNGPWLCSWIGMLLPAMKHQADPPLLTNVFACVALYGWVYFSALPLLPPSPTAHTEEGKTNPVHTLAHTRLTKEPTSKKNKPQKRKENDVGIGIQYWVSLLHQLFMWHLIGKQSWEINEKAGRHHTSSF